MRKCIEIEVAGLRLRGTVHMAEPNAGTEFGGLGAIILHPGFLPRSAQADSAVVLAETLARSGIQTVRIDLPGLGDSEGDLPEDSFTFIDTVQEAGLAGVALECVDRIKEQMGWRKVIVGGHCGGAITAFYALALREDNWPAGIFALDLIYYLVRPIQAPVKNAEGVIVREPKGLRREVLRNEVRLALLNTPLGGPLQKMAQRVREILNRLRSKRSQMPPPSPSAQLPPKSASGQLPPEANLKLVQCIEQVLRSRLPILFVTAYDPTKPSHFDYTEYLLTRCPGRATHKTIAGTDHGFISGDGKSRVSECIMQWVGAEFGKAMPPAGKPLQDKTPVTPLHLA